MGLRKRQTAEKIKEAKKDVAFAKLNNCPTSPRKMRLVADTVRGKKVDTALTILKFSQKEASNKLEKLLMSAISNWQSKNEDADVEQANLFVKEIRVDSAGMLKRLRPAPQGRAHRIRKRSNHVTLILGSQNSIDKAPVGQKSWDVCSASSVARWNPIWVQIGLEPFYALACCVLLHFQKWAGGVPTLSTMYTFALVNPTKREQFRLWVANLCVQHALSSL